MDFVLAKIQCGQMGVRIEGLRARNQSPGKTDIHMDGVMVSNVRFKSHPTIYFKSLYLSGTRGDGSVCACVRVRLCVVREYVPEQSSERPSPLWY